MILFRYLGSHGEATLRSRLLKVSKVSSFNDPFECAYRITGKMTLTSCRKYIRDRWDNPSFLQRVLGFMPELKSLKKAKRHLKSNIDYWAAHILKNEKFVIEGLREKREALMDETMRVASFAASDVDPKDEILLWSHYAQKHTGIRIGFEFPENKGLYGIAPIDYREERIGLDISVNPEAAANQTAIEKTFRTKSTAWAYEKEHRLITATIVCKRGMPPNEELEFLPFEPSWVKRIDFGLRHDRKMRDQIVQLATTTYPHVKLHQAEYSDDSYSLKYEQL